MPRRRAPSPSRLAALIGALALALLPPLVCGPLRLTPRSDGETTRALRLAFARAPGGVALRGGTDSADEQSGDDADTVRSVKATLRDYDPREVTAATEYLSRQLRARTAAGGGRADVKVHGGSVEVSYGDPARDPEAQLQEVLEEQAAGSGHVPTSIEHMRRELRERMAEEDELSRNFFDAVLQRNLSAAHSLLEQGADPNWRHPLHHLNTVLHKVAAAGEQDTVGFLLDNGASVHVTNLFGDTPIMASAGGAGMEPVHGVTKDEWSPSWRGGEKPSMEVQKWADDVYRVSKMLMDAGAHVLHANNYSNTPLHKAAANGFPRNAELFLRGGALANFPNQAGETPLHLAAFGGHLRTCMVLVEQGADVNARDLQGDTPLWEANRLKRIKVLRYLRQFTTDLSWDPHRWLLAHGDESSEEARQSEFSDPDSSTSVSQTNAAADDETAAAGQSSKAPGSGSAGLSGFTAGTSHRGKELFKPQVADTPALSLSRSHAQKRSIKFDGIDANEVEKELGRGTN